MDKCITKTIKSMNAPENGLCAKQKKIISIQRKIKVERKIGKMSAQRTLQQ